MKIIKNTELNTELEVRNAKLGIKLDNSGNVQFSATDNGLKGQVTLPEAFDPSTLNEKIQALETAKTAAENKVKALETKVQALETRDDIKLSAAEMDGNNLKLTTTDDVVITVDMSKFMNVVPSAEDTWTSITALSNFKEKMLEVLKGEEVKGLDDVVAGYLLPTA